MGRAPCCEKVGLKKGRWTAEEDEILSKYIQEKGEGSWRSLPKNAGLLRCGKSCRLRWINYLRSDVKRGNISAAEEDIIIKLHESFGNRWSLIAGHLPGRTDNEIKNYWNSHLSRRIHCFRRTNKDGASVAVLMDMGKLVGGYKRKVGRTSRSAMKKTLTRNTEIREMQNDNNAPTLLLKDEAQRPIKVPNGERKDTLLEPYKGNGEVLTPSRERLCGSFCPQVELDGGILCPNQGMGSVDLGGNENTENGAFSETIERENGILNPHEEIEDWLLSLDEGLDSPNEEERESGLLGGKRERDCRVMGASEESEGRMKVDKCCTSMESWFDEFDGLQEKWKDWEWDEMENKTREDVNERWSWLWDSSSWDWDCEGGTVETM